MTKKLSKEHLDELINALYGSHGCLQSENYQHLMMLKTFVKSAMIEENEKGILAEDMKKLKEWLCYLEEQGEI